MLLWTKQVLFAKHVAMLIQFIFAQGLSVSFGEAWRTPEQAKWDFEHHIGIIDSLHCKRLAVDLNFHDMDGSYIKDPKRYEFAGKYWESLHPQNRWGGRFSHGCARGDATHFEMMDVEMKNANGIKR